jgi:hypothetical protein
MLKVEAPTVGLSDLPKEATSSHRKSIKLTMKSKSSSLNTSQDLLLARLPAQAERPTGTVKRRLVVSFTLMDHPIFKSLVLSDFAAAALSTTA